MTLPNKITLHWSAGTYHWIPDELSYHFVIDGDGKVTQLLSVYERGAHTWKRNTGNIGVSMLCMVDNQTLPKEIQIEHMACLVAELMHKFNIDVSNVHDHAYYAKIDGYYPERWDIGEYEPIVAKKSCWYLNKIKSGERKYQFINNLK